MSSNSAVFTQTEDLYLHHHSWLVGWLQRRLGCSETSLDLAQDTFVRLLNKSELIAVREPRAYLSTIAHSLAVNHLRRRDVEKAYLETLALQDAPVVPSLEEQNLTIEALTTIITVLEGLPTRACEVFLLAQVEGLAYKQIAARLEITVNMVQKDMIKAMARCYAAVYS